MRNVVITSAVRTPVGRIGGALKDVLPEDLAQLVLKEAINRSSLDIHKIDEVIFGQTKQSSDAPNIARVVSLKAGLPEEIPAYTVHRQCGSGMQAVHNAFLLIGAGMADIVIAGGVESMSTAPFYLRKARYGYGAGNGELVDPNTESQPKSQPVEIYGSMTMGLTAENLAEKYGIARQEQDIFALSSQEKALKAIRDGKFQEEIIPVTVPQRKGKQVTFEVDEHPRETSVEKLAALPPVFKANGTVTAGNSSGRNDGASAVVVMAEETALQLGIKPLTRVISIGAAGVSPGYMGIGPVCATQKALGRIGMDLKQIELIEVNEAFAAQTLAVIKELDIDAARLNVNGGAIALGHALGNSGTRIVVTLIHEMKKRGAKYGLASLCIAGGMGITTVFEGL